MEHSEQLQYDRDRLQSRAQQLARKRPMRIKDLEELHRVQTRISKIENELEAIRRQLPLW